MDILLKNTLDGGDINIQNGDVVADNTLTSGIYISLFGGNDNWFANKFIEDEQAVLNDELNQELKQIPTTQRLLKIEQIATNQLSWVADNDITYEVAAEYDNNNLILKIKFLFTNGKFFDIIINKEWCN